MDTDTITFSPTRTFGGLTVDCTIDESHTDSMTVSEHPVELGANISDHAYMDAAILTMHVGWSNSSDNGGRYGDDYVRDTYDALLALQQTRMPFAVVTGKRTYPLMLFKSLSVTTDANSEASLTVNATLREIITVQTQVVSMPKASVQAKPEATAAPVAAGPKQPKPTAVVPKAAT